MPRSMLRRPSITAVVCAVTTLALGLGAARDGRAVDGVLEINQACASAGCFAGDVAGFPVTISASGSYRLTGNLDTSADPNVDGINVTASDVTIDLNGFTVGGPVTCTGLGSAVSCTPVGTGRGIFAFVTGLTVRDGKVRGYGEQGIRGFSRARVRNVVAESNGDTGIELGSWSIISESTGHQNGGSGITIGFTSVVSHSVGSRNAGTGISANVGSSVVGSTAFENGDDGISGSATSVLRDNSSHQNEDDGIVIGAGGLVSDCAARSNAGDGIEASSGDASVQRNVVTANGGFGLRLAVASGYRENLVNDNTGGTVSGGVDAGANICNGTTTCP